ncbi:uncharacterized protein LOC116345478 [Contarinia nasturtii]|uniref:uncharacterized protein LOC116345478 n=1 Tax=Contarinia nasturtii TaxID=265458 RepID=UPI0012D3E669|nr:uncharacterized protein LOC116345478 [Contarinia nasturtii]
MKQFLFLVILSILVFDEMCIKGATGDQYDTIVSAFTSKAKATLKNEKNCLEPYFQQNKMVWCSEIPPLFSLCTPDDFSSLSNTMNLLIQANVNTSLDQLLDGNDIRGVLTNRKAVDELCEEIKFKLELTASSIFYPPEIDSVYHEWKNTYITQYYLLKVVVNLPILKENHELFYKRFEHYILSVVNENLETYQLYSNRFSDIYRSHEYQRIDGYLEHFVQIQLTILERLRKARDVLVDYYKRRINWAKFLMGKQVQI